MWEGTSKMLHQLCENLVGCLASFFTFCKQLLILLDVFFYVVAEWCHLG